MLAATQKILDRVLFIAFAEDRGLLPSETIAKAYRHADPYNPRPIWDNFRGLFRSVDEGNPQLQIERYNGGLFAPDELLERLIVPDNVCKALDRLAAYDYRNPTAADDEAPPGPAKLIDVEILGHIFEQSITDLEQMRNAIAGGPAAEETKPAPSKRKREGAFYTPSFITRYIVAATLRPALEERFAAFRRRRREPAPAAVRKVLDDPDAYDVASLRPAQKTALVDFWEGWQDDLATLRIVDPACGSGAFLIEAFEQLHAVYQQAQARLIELRGPRLFDVDRQILEHNLYGVDLNDEAVDICRLSLWIKTAALGKVLTSLDHGVRAGNSVIADKSIHPEAFDWKAAFPEVFAAGGFDVVIGNPPYIRQEWLAPYKAYWQTAFESFDSVADIYAYFYELGVKLLRPEGRLGFITSGSWVRGNFGEALRRFLTTNARLEEMIDFGEFQPFEDAEMIRPTIAILSKRSPGGALKLFKWLTSGRPPENLGDAVASAPTMRTDHLGKDAWELESDEVIDLRKKLAARGRMLREFTGGKLFRGILTGLTDVFVIDDDKKRELLAHDVRSADLIRPFAQGTHLRPWYMEKTGQHLLAIKSSVDHQWPWSETGERAESVFAETYPAIYDHLKEHKDRAVKRSDKGRYWWELRSCAYWAMFEQDKIVWPDISKLPRFSVDVERHCVGNTVYTIPGKDSYLLAVLSSWATWFFISKTAQPLRLRENRWQYRLFTQFMENVPIPVAPDNERNAVASLAERCCSLAEQQYTGQIHVQDRLIAAFGQDEKGQARGVLNNKAKEWWEQPLSNLGTALKESFKLPRSPFTNPKTADEWEPYLTEKRGEIESLAKQLADAEAEINERVYKLFQLTPADVKLLQREVEH